MWALVDANSFFASVEKVFHPGLKGKPVVVLSSNDGIIVALTPEAKAVGLHRGDAVFKVKDIIARNNVAVFSGNMVLYDAMSKRVVSILRSFVDRVDQYSIDECFADLSGYADHYDLAEYMRSAADRIKLWTDIPVSVGIAPTKTLAKIGSKYAKQYRGYRSVCVIDTEEKRRKALSAFDLADVWGIGRRSYEKLRSLGVATPLEFADKSGEWVSRFFHKPGLQTWRELNGHPCIDTTEMLQRQTITTSRSFGEMITSLEQIKASVATFAAGCANKLRGQGSSTRAVTVYLCSNFFREDLEQYYNAATFRFGIPTADTLEITAAALKLTEEIFKPGIRYKKSGVVLSEIEQGSVHHLLFDPIADREERLVLSDALDRLNRKFGLKSVSLAVEGYGGGGRGCGSRDGGHGVNESRIGQPWCPKSEYRSGAYLTDINEILTVHV